MSSPYQSQILLFAGAITLGLTLGTLAPSMQGMLEAAIWPVLGALLYVTFLQTHLRTLGTALRDIRFLTAAFLANFAIVPVVVWVLLELHPTVDAVRVGILLVLLAPCTDWFSSFTLVGRGDMRLAIAVTPLLLALQAVFVPAYLWLFTDLDASAVPILPLVVAVTVVILLPLALAALTQESRLGPALIERVDVMVTPLLAAVIFLVASSQVPAIRDAGGELGWAAAVFVAYATIALLIAALVAKVARLPAAASRTLAFNLGTRNSFVVLPVALALPDALALAAPVVAMQTLIELFAMLVYVRFVPSRVFPD